MNRPPKSTIWDTLGLILFFALVYLYLCVP